MQYLLNKRRSLDLASLLEGGGGGGGDEGGNTFLPQLSLNPLNLQIKALDGSRQSKVQYAGSLFTGLSLLFALWHGGGNPFISAAVHYRLVD